MSGGRLIEGTAYSSTWSGLVLMAMILYVAAYATGIGNIAWFQGELLALEVRGIGTSLCTATNWVSGAEGAGDMVVLTRALTPQSMNLLISSTFLSLMDAATPSGAFGLYAGLCVLGWLFCVLLYPETSGCVVCGVTGRKSRADDPELHSLSMEEVYTIFQDDFGIEKSRELRVAKEEQRLNAEATRIGAEGHEV